MYRSLRPMRFQRSLSRQIFPPQWVPVFSQLFCNIVILCAISLITRTKKGEIKTDCCYVLICLMMTKYITTSCARWKYSTHVQPYGSNIVYMSIVCPCGQHFVDRQRISGSTGGAGCENKPSEFVDTIDFTCVYSSLMSVWTVFQRLFTFGLTCSNSIEQ